MGDSHQRVPTQSNNLLKQPAGIQPAIAHDDHGPSGGNQALKRAQQRDPFWFPRVSDVGLHDLPGHRAGAAAIDDTDRQDGETVAQTGGVQRQGQSARRPPLQGPGQQGSETGGDVEFAPPRSRTWPMRVDRTPATASGRPSNANQTKRPRSRRRCSDRTAEPGSHRNCKEPEPSPGVEKDSERPRRPGRSTSRVDLWQDMAEPSVTKMAFPTSCSTKVAVSCQLATSFHLVKNPSL